MFKDIPGNELVIRIQPKESIFLTFNTKRPGVQQHLVPTGMDLIYQQRFEHDRIPDVYESLIRDVIRGDHSNFMRDDEMDIAWKVVYFGSFFLPILVLITLKYA